MKTYSSNYTPKSMIALCNSRKLNVERIEQAIDATLTGLKVKTDFTGLAKVKGEKGEEEAVFSAVARMPQGSVKDALCYMRDIHRAEKSAKKCGGVVTLADFPALVSSWFNSFAEKANGQTKAEKAQAKKEAKEAIAATVAQVESVKAS